MWISSRMWQVSPKRSAAALTPAEPLTWATASWITPAIPSTACPKEQMTEAYTRLMALGAKNFGNPCFLASNTVTDDYYPELAGILFNLAVRLHQKTGAHIKFINLSGGVGIAYKPEQRSNDILAIGEGVRKKFEEILVPPVWATLHLYRDGALYAGSVWLPGCHSHPRKAHL